MKFGETALDDAVGAILAHSLKLPGRTLKKGRVLTAEDVAALRAARRESVVAARLEPGEVDENVAATAFARLVPGQHVSVGRAFTGRVNFFADMHGICVIDRAGVDRFNLVDETITLSTLEPFTVVAPKQMVATVKVIPFAVSGAILDACTSHAETAGPLFHVAPLRATRVGLIQTRLLGLKESILDKTAETTRARLDALGSTLVLERRCEHSRSDLAPLVTAAATEGCEMILVAGASAIVDRRDVIPAALTTCGGTIEHFGMPVDPGNLMLVGRLGAVPVLGLPGCARSIKVNGFDWVLQRLLADLPVGADEIRRMGVGGLLAEIAGRPLPRALASPQDEAAPRAPRIAALVLAAGRSQRMGTLNKLLISIDGKPMVRHVAEAVRDSHAKPIVVVTGHQRELVEAALAGLPAACVFNPDYAGGLSTSLKRGLAALPDDIDGVVICLGDMPRVVAAEIDRLIAAFNPVEGREIIVPTRRGKRGNPVLWGKRFLAEMRELAGDVGARHLIGAYPEAVVELEMESDAVLTDIDTPQALARLAATVKVDA